MGNAIARGMHDSILPPTPNAGPATQQVHAGGSDKLQGSQGILWGWARWRLCLVPPWQILSALNAPQSSHVESPYRISQPWGQLLSRTSGRGLKATHFCWLAAFSWIKLFTLKISHSQGPRLHTGEKAYLPSTFEILGQLLMYFTGCDKWVSV